jgi:Ni,Fe-hydrogenase III large subunit
MRFAAGGVIARAAGIAADLRLSPGCAPYATLAPAVRTEGDAEARARVRLADIEDSIRLLRALLEALPAGAVSVPLPTGSGEGVGFAEGVHGGVWHWLRIDHGQIASVFMRDPGWAHWPLLEAVAAGTQAENLPLVMASFGLGSSGVDL